MAHYAIVRHVEVLPTDAQLAQRLASAQASRVADKVLQDQLVADQGARHAAEHAAEVAEKPCAALVADHNVLRDAAAARERLLRVEESTVVRAAASTAKRALDVLLAGRDAALARDAAVRQSHVQGGTASKATTDAGSQRRLSEKMAGMGNASCDFAFGGGTAGSVGDHHDANVAQTMHQEQQRQHDGGEQAGTVSTATTVLLPQGGTLRKWLAWAMPAAILQMVVRLLARMGIIMMQTWSRHENEPAGMNNASSQSEDGGETGLSAGNYVRPGRTKKQLMQQAAAAAEQGNIVECQRLVLMAEGEDPNHTPWWRGALAS